MDGLVGLCHRAATRQLNPRDCERDERSSRSDNLQEPLGM